MTNDEVYYWDWSRHLQLSYVDAPPMVAWISYVGTIFLKKSLGSRLLIPFIHIFSTIFLIKSVFILSNLKNNVVKNSQIFYLLILTQVTPVFNLEGFLLLPDASLLLGISGALYFLLKMLVSKRGNIWFGFFLGLAALSKYHALPISIGFLCAAILIRKKQTVTNDIPFWIGSIIIALFVSSPVFIWNIQNHFASFLFQGQHGFSGFSINFNAFGRYILGMIFYLLPWFFVPLLFFGFKNLFNKKSITNHTIVCTLPFFFIFILILFSSLGKQALPHWAMPGFFLLIPAFVLEWKPLTTANKKIWRKLIILSSVLTILLPSLFSIKIFNQFIVNEFVYFTGNADPLAQAIQWETLENELNIQQNIKVYGEAYSSLISSKYCSKNKSAQDPNTYVLASLRWYWTAQMAFNFKNQPRVFNFDLSNSSFYTWRDQLDKLSGCPVIVIGSRNQYDENELKEIMTIEKIRFFSLTPFNGNKMVYIEGIMKNKAQLLDVYHRIKRDIKY